MAAPLAAAGSGGVGGVEAASVCGGGGEMATPMTTAGRAGKAWS